MKSVKLIFDSIKKKNYDRTIKKNQLELNRQALIDNRNRLNFMEEMISRKAVDHGLPIFTSALNHVNGIYRDVTEFNMITIEDETTARNQNYNGFKTPIFNKDTYDFLQDAIRSSLPIEYRLVWQNDPLYINNYIFKFIIESNESKRLTVDSDV